MIQGVLIIGSDTWVVAPRMGKALRVGSNPGSKTADGTAPTEDNRQDMEIHYIRVGKGGGRDLKDGGIRQAAP